MTNEIYRKYVFIPLMWEKWPSSDIFHPSIIFCSETAGLIKATTMSYTPYPIVEVAKYVHDVKT